MTFCRLSIDLTCLGFQTLLEFKSVGLNLDLSLMGLDTGPFSAFWKKQYQFLN